MEPRGAGARRRSDLDALRRRRLVQLLHGFRQRVDEEPHIPECAVKRRRRHADDIGLSIVDHDAATAEAGENRMHGLVRLELQAQLASPRGRVRGRDHLHIAGISADETPLLQQRLEEAGQQHRPAPQFRHGGLAKNFEAGQEGDGLQHRRIRQAPSGGAVLGLDRVGHVEAGGLLLAPPAGQHRKPLAMVLLVHEEAPDAAWSGIEVLVGAPASPIDAPVVQLQVQVPHGVGAVPKRRRADALRGRGDLRHLEELAAVILHSAEAYDRQGVAGLLDRLDDVLRSQQLLALSRGQRQQGLRRRDAVQPSL
mmetsp:Transcript_32544/g.95239  ORF Transcript_32544/g.95239 Transcript_32544/m.95239 type:complete len:310 (-) Transcript_32544:654-1583(-)